MYLADTWVQSIKGQYNIFQYILKILPSEIFPLTVNTNKTLKNKYYNNHVHNNYIYVYHIGIPIVSYFYKFTKIS